MDNLDENMLFQFYRSPLGKTVRRLVTRQLEKIYTPGATANHDTRVSAGIGYARPYMKLLSPHSGHQIVLQFSGYHLRSWPKGKPSRLAEVDDSNMPLLSSSLNDVLMIHGLEVSVSPVALLDEIWRLLKGSGRLTVVLPHRRGLWSSQEHTPFGHGQPFSQRQIRHLLEDRGFHVHTIRSALVLPPITPALYLRTAPLVEHLPHTFGGVLVVEAEKMIYSVKPLTRKAWQLRSKAVTNLAKPSPKSRHEAKRS